MKAYCPSCKLTLPAALVPGVDPYGNPGEDILCETCGECIATIQQNSLPAQKPSLEEVPQKARFEAHARGMMEFLGQFHHPHVTVIITATNAELLSGEMAFTTQQYVKD